MALEKLIMSFGFTRDSTVIAIICVVVLLGNFAGGLMSNIILAQGKMIRERKLLEKTSFRLVVVSDLMLLIYAVYYHAMLVQSVNVAQLVYWAFTLIAAPLLAALGAQASYLAFAKKIEALKKKGRKKALAEQAEKFEKSAADGRPAKPGAKGAKTA